MVVFSDYPEQGFWCTPLSPNIRILVTLTKKPAYINWGIYVHNKDAFFVLTLDKTISDLK